jgi:hypothetical protein
MSGQNETFRLALSYLERAQAELRRWEKLRADGKLDRTNYDQVRAKYAAHERDARKLCSALRRAAEGELGPAEAELRQRQRTQRKWIEAASAGGVDARKANEQNRRLTAEIAAGAARVEELQAIVSADTTAALGGAIELPLEEYPKRLDLVEAGALPRRKLTPHEKNLVAGGVMLVLVLGTVFGLAVLRSSVRAEFSVSGSEIQTGFVRVQCTNSGNRSIEFYAPWPNNQTHAPAGARWPNRSFGALLFVREIGDNEFRALEGAAGAWKFRGAYLDEGTPVDVAPKVTVSIYLDLDHLREQGLDLDALALEFTRNGGGERRREEVQVAP